LLLLIRRRRAARKRQLESAPVLAVAGIALRAAAAIAAVVTALAVAPAISRADPPTPGQYGEHDAGGFRNILPPGEGANVSLDQILRFEGDGTYPPHANDQMGMYANLLYAAPG